MNFIFAAGTTQSTSCAKEENEKKNTIKMNNILFIGYLW